MPSFIFDVDNTLTPPRKKILDEHIKLLNHLISKYNVYLVSGSDYEKLKSQLPIDILNKCAGIFSCLGNCYHVGEELKYKNIFLELNQPELRQDIQKFILNSKTPLKTGNHIEERIGMLNVSSVGRNASIPEREIYNKFDLIEQERKIFVDFLKSKYSNLDVSVGGEISIDISVKGFNKSQILKHINHTNNLIFFGDRCEHGGNDEPLAKEILKMYGIVYNVKDYLETFKIIKKLLLLEFGE